MNDAEQILLMRQNLDDVFNERDGTLRLQAIQSLYSEDAIFYEGEDKFEGWLAISKRFDAILAPTPPDFAFRVAGHAGRIHDLEQLSWELGPSVGPPVARGLDVALIEDGRIKVLYTFIDPEPRTRNELQAPSSPIST